MEAKIKHKEMKLMGKKMKRFKHNKHRTVKLKIVK